MLLLLSITLAFDPQGALSINAPKQIIDKLSSKNRHERKDAYYYSMQYLIGKKRNDAKSFFLKVINSKDTIKQKDGTYNKEDMIRSPRRIALSIIAEWCDPDFIPVFVNYLTYYAPDPQLVVGDGELYEKYAAIKGLINIGRKSIPFCIDGIVNSEKYQSIHDDLASKITDDAQAQQRELHYTHVLCKILGNSETKELLGSEHDKIISKDPRGAAKLQKCIDCIQAQR